MGNNIIQNTNENTTESNGTSQGDATQTDTITSKRAAVRQRLALALMAVGGILVAAIIWLSLRGSNSGQ